MAFKWNNAIRRVSGLAFLMFLLLASCQQTRPSLSVETAMDSIVTRLYATLSPDQLDTLGQDFILDFITDEEREALASNYWRFEVNVPVVVSLMRDRNQAQPPFWLMQAGFRKTAMTVNNSEYHYEVWQKELPAGEVALGINGFDKHRPVYFVSVAPQDEKKQLNIIPIYPVAQHIDAMEVGAFTYHDWDGLTLTEVPQNLRGQLLLTTIRGRAREAHLIKAFRQTAYPSTEEADQITLTLDEDPATQMTVQWRANPAVKRAWVAYWQEADTARQEAEASLLEDRLLINDRYVNRFSARLTKLMPNSRYYYCIEQDGERVSDTFQFTTAPVENEFSFHWFGDTHNDLAAGNLIKLASEMHPDAAFNLCSGDLVNTGLYRDDWDDFFHHAGDVFARQPLMAVAGNHDSQDGLGAGMFQSLLSYPKNGPEGLVKGLTYAFHYQNALFVMLDAASFSIDDQTEWLASQLASSTATWKFVVLHFPPFNEVEPYPEIVNHWVPLFDQYGVDIVLGGHFHYYMRTHPMKGGVADENGTTYLMSVATSAAREAADNSPFVAIRMEHGNFYQYFRIKNNQLTYSCYDRSGEVKDQITVSK